MIHLVRLYIANDGDVTVAEGNAIANQWIEDNIPWDADTTSHELRAVSTDSGVDYFTGDFRFEFEQDLVPLLDGAEQLLRGRAPWYRIGYHACTHDESGGDCSWDSEETREFGSVPEEIPEF